MNSTNSTNELTSARFGIWCQVSGGITGERAGLMKDKGEIMTFLDRTAAEARAATYRAATRGGIGARFAYTVKELT
jgi:hypothetical protein